MIKMTMFLKRKAGMSHEDFVKHHIEVHGPKFRSIPEAQTIACVISKPIP